MLKQKLSSENSEILNCKHFTTGYLIYNYLIAECGCGFPLSSLAHQRTILFLDDSP